MKSFVQPQHVLFFQKKRERFSHILLHEKKKDLEVVASLTSHQYLSCIMAQHYFPSSPPPSLSLAHSTAVFLLKISAAKNEFFLSPLAYRHNGKRFISLALMVAAFERHVDDYDDDMQYRSNEKCFS